MTRRIGVCSWSMCPEGPNELAKAVVATGATRVQLHLDPLGTEPWLLSETQHILKVRGLRVVSGMQMMIGEDYSTLETIHETGGVRPGEHFEDNVVAAKKNASLCQAMGIDLVSFHAGFLPPDPADPERDVLVDRLSDIIDIYCERGVRVAFETGQETADTLLDVLGEWDAEQVGVNFDPGNMILYGMGDPVEALDKLAPRVFQVHLKDAIPAETVGTWGAEAPFGDGVVDWTGFFAVLKKHELEVNLLVERELEEQCLETIQQARSRASELLV